MAHQKYGITLAALGIAASLFSATVNAAQPGLYIGGQIGWGNVNDAGISSADMSEMITSALGYSNYTISSFKGTTSDSGFAWRVYGGYQVGYQWAGEIGWAQYPRLSVHAPTTGTDLNTGLPYTVGTTGTFKVAVFDAVGKFIWPLPCHFNAYGKLGLAYVTGWSNESAALSEPGGFTAAGEESDTNTSLFPTFAVGVSYDFRPDISADLSYSRVQKVGNSDQLGSLDFVALGLALYFG